MRTLLEIHSRTLDKRPFRGGLANGAPRGLLSFRVLQHLGSRAHRNVFAQRLIEGCVLCRTGEQVAAAEKGWGDEDHGNGNVVHLIDGNFAE